MCLYDKQNNTWLLVDMEFPFSCSTWHLTRSLRYTRREIPYLRTLVYYSLYLASWNRKPMGQWTSSVNDNGSRFPRKSIALQTQFFSYLDCSVERWGGRHNIGQSCKGKGKTRGKKGKAGECRCREARQRIDRKEYLFSNKEYPYCWSEFPS